MGPRLRRIGSFVALLGVLLLTAGSATAAPLSWTDPVEIAPNSSIEALQCESVTECTAFSQIQDDFTARTFNPANPGAAQTDVSLGTTFSDAACPSVDLCVVAEESDAILVFDPRSSAAPNTITPEPTSPAYLYPEVRCPSASLCVLKPEGAYNQFDSFDPQTSAAGTPSFFGENSPDGAARGFACADLSHCTSLNSAGDVFDFDPQSTYSPDTAAPAAPVGTLPADVSAIQCLSPSECIADSPSSVIRFDPTTPSTAVSEPSPSAAILDTACPSPTECVAVGARSVWQGDPANAATWPQQAVDAAGPGLAHVACMTTTYCVAAEHGANVIVGTPPAPNKPSTPLGRATVPTVAATANGARVTIRCAGPSVVRCTFTLDLAAGLKHGYAATRTLTIKPGRKTLTLKLSPAARRLLVRDHMLVGTVSAFQRLYSGSITLLVRRVTIYAGRS